MSPRILFVRTDRLGETVLNLPAAHALRQVMPRAHVILMVGAAVHELLVNHPGVDEVIAEPAWAGPWWQRAFHLSRLWRSWRIETVIVSNPKKEYHLAAWVAGIPHRVGYDCKWSALLTHRLPDRKALGGRHEVESNLDLVRLLGLPVSIPQWQWPSFAREQEEVFGLLAAQGINRSDPWIVIHPWTSHPAKQWPLPRYRGVIRAMSRDRSIGIVVIGGPEERARVQAVLPKGLPVADLVGRLTLRQLAALLQHARLLVSNDSGPVHLAAAMGTPTVVLFGTSDPATGPARWGPWGQGHTVICQPRLEQIDVDEVLQAIHTHVSMVRPTQVAV